MTSGLPALRPLRAAVAGAALALPTLAGAEEGTPGRPVLPPLPPPVAGEARAAASRALDDPDLVASLLRARRDVERAGRRGPEWSVDGGWHADWDGGTGFDASLSVEVPIFEPALVRDAADAASHLERARLDASLHARSAAEELVQARIALWRARTIAERLEAARAIEPHARGEAARRLRSLLEHEPTARFEIRRLEAAIARAATGRAPAPLGAGPWKAIAASPRLGCPEGDADVVRARADLAAASKRAAAGAAAGRPTVRAGASAALRGADVSAGPVDLSGRVWLQVGMPRSWSVVGTVRTEVDVHGAEARIRVSGPDDGEPGTRDALRSARRALERARFGAHDDDAYRRHELSRAESRLAALETLAPPARSVDAVERDLEVAELVAARASLLVTMAFACAWAP